MYVRRGHSAENTDFASAERSGGAWHKDVDGHGQRLVAEGAFQETREGEGGDVVRSRSKAWRSTPFVKSTVRLLGYCVAQ